MQADFDIADFEWLASNAAVEVLALARRERLTVGFSPLKLANRLRKLLSPSRARLVLEQIELRVRARDKFSLAERMFFTPVGLEQATDEWIAHYKAARLATGETVVDLCSGIGGDALGLARRGGLVAVDRSPAAVILCAANLRTENDSGQAPKWSLDVRQAEIGTTGAAREWVASASAWHIDPDRRPSGRRTTHVELHEPGTSVLRSLLEINANAAIKLSPATTLEGDLWDEAELEWISRARQCRQLVAWFGNLAHATGKRRATIVSTSDPAAGDGQARSVSFVGVPDIRCEVADRLRRFVFEPDAAVLAANLQGALANEHQLLAIAHDVDYFTADQSVDCTMLSCFEVLETLPLDVKRLKAWLASRQIGRLEVKKRGVAIDPAQLARQLRGPGAEAATLLVARIRGQVMAIVARRIAAR